MNQIVLNDTVYFTAADIVRERQISRQTFWRWRQEGKIPSGHRFRASSAFFKRTAEDMVVGKKVSRDWKEVSG